jgi:outer membrane receptor protein involved in Fe transport
LHHAVAAAALAVLHMGAGAQTAGQLQEVTVTAERRLENIREVPSSVSALQGDILEAVATSGQDVRALSGRVPSLNIESSFGRAFPRFYIRGYGNTDFRLNASQPVSLVYDDVVQENPILKGFPVFDVDRVEVLRGPQGSLFGRNTPAGVVKFDSVRPGKQHDGYASVSAGTFSSVNVEAAGNFQLGNSLSMRVSLLNQSRKDWVENTYQAGPTQDLEGYRDSAMRLQWLFDGGKDLSVLANVHARDYEGSARLFRANVIQPGTNNPVAGFDERKISVDGKNHSELQNYGGNLRVRLGLGAAREVGGHAREGVFRVFRCAGHDGRRLRRTGRPDQRQHQSQRQRPAPRVPPPQSSHCRHCRHHTTHGRGRGQPCGLRSPPRRARAVQRAAAAVRHPAAPGPPLHRAATPVRCDRGWRADPGRPARPGPVPR